MTSLFEEVRIAAACPQRFRLSQILACGAKRAGKAVPTGTILVGVLEYWLPAASCLLPTLFQSVLLDAVSHLVGGHVKETSGFQDVSLGPFEGFFKQPSDGLGVVQGSRRKVYSRALG